MNHIKDQLRHLSCIALAVSLPAIAHAAETTPSPSAATTKSDTETTAKKAADTKNQAVKLETVTVEAAAETADGPVTGYHAQRSATGTRTDTPLIQTPVSVQVVSRELMDDQQVQTLGDAVKNVSGVYTRQGPDGNTMDAFNIRGFQVHSYGGSYLDGVKDFSRAPKEMAGLERVEVLKGPSAIMYGRIEPGGMINRVSKKPQAEEFTKIQQQFGTDNFYRTTVDSNGSLSKDQSVLYRVNVAAQDSDGYKDDTYSRTLYVAPQVEWHPGDRTTIRTGIDYQKNDKSWAQNYGTIGDTNGPVDVPISTNLHDKDDSYKDESLAWNLYWNYLLSDDWSVQQRVTYVDRDSVAEGSLLTAADATGNYRRTYWGWDDEQAQITSTNIDLTGKVTTGAIKHTLLMGVDYFYEDYDSGGWATGGTALTTNVYNPNNIDAPYDANYTAAEYWYDNENFGAYLQDQMAMLDDRLHLMVGLRYDDADYYNFYGTAGNGTTDEALTWRGGILYQFVPSVSVYYSYVEGFGSPNTSSQPGVTFDPQTSHQHEIGTKFEPTSRIGVTLAVFELVKDNLTMADPNDITRTILAGEATSKGAELDINGQVTENWNVNVAYAYTDVRYTKSDRMQGERLHSIPRHGASLWNTYRFAGTGWKVGGGVVYRSERLGLQRVTNPALYPYMMDDYTLVDLMASYDFGLANLPWTAQVNVNNATDEEYFPSTYGNLNRIAQGTPRNIIGSISVQF
ncbi:MAG TPA: TonB-dependent siderophore receptor [Dongiaceae bacterium]|nr:TonB-dependent siderophore receptor [Dongiaceae bacterium]